MRILLLGQRYNPFRNGAVLGGAERVEQTYLSLLDFYDHDVHFLTNTDSDVAIQASVKTYSVTPSKFSPAGKALKNELSKRRNAFAINLARKIEPDIIINNDCENNSLAKMLGDLDIPSMTFVHSHVRIAGGIAMFGYIKSLSYLGEMGQTVVAVSEASRREWFGQMKKSKKWLEADVSPATFEFPEYTFQEVAYNCFMWEKPAVKETEHDYVVLGRLVKVKNLSTAAKLLKDKLVVFTPSVKTDEEGEYLNEIRSYGSEVRIGETEERIMDYVAKSKALISMAYESFGLTAFEANSLGTPVILHNQMEDHPIIEACAPATPVDGFHNLPWSKSHEEFLSFTAKFRGLELAEKQEVQDATWAFYNDDAMHTRTIALFDRVIERWRTGNAGNQVKKMTLDGFFD